MTRLGWSTLGQCAPQVRRPAYRPEQVSIGVVHLGVGNFHRAHQAPCMDDAIARGDARWGISGVSLKRPLLRDALAPQGGLYALDAGEGGLRIIGAIREVLVAGTDDEAIVARMADARVSWWTLTVTEKGYCLGPRGPDAGATPASIALDHSNPGLQADLAFATRLQTAPGQLFAAIVRRFGERAHAERAGALPRLDAVQASARLLTIASCDNLSGNGRSLRAALLAFAEAARREPAWRASAGRLAGTQGPVDAIDAMPALIATSIACPDSMVDRIVPATTDALRDRVDRELGVSDAWPVATEPFTQWVIEDSVLGPRPELERSGVEWVDDVGLHEALKLRLLNAAHSVLAYAGLLAGHTTVSEAIGDPAIRRFVERFWRGSAIPALPPAAQSRAPAYCASLLERFSNPAIRHALAQIAQDGSLKIPLRWLGGTDPGDDVAVALACWIRWLRRTPLEGLADPRALDLKHAADTADDGRAVSGALAIVGADSPRLAARVARALADPLLAPGITGAG